MTDEFLGNNTTQENSTSIHGDMLKGNESRDARTAQSTHQSRIYLSIALFNFILTYFEVGGTYF